MTKNTTAGAMTRKDKRGLALLLAIIMAVPLIFIIGDLVQPGHPNACRQQWQAAPAHHYTSYVDYKRDVCDAPALPAPTDTNPADQPY